MASQQQPMPGTEGMNERDQQELNSMVDSMQTRDSLRMYNALVERCFSECVDSFRRKTLEQGEEKCVQRCCEKFLKHSARVSVRFSELNSANDGSVAAQATQQAQPQQPSS